MLESTICELRGHLKEAEDIGKQAQSENSCLQRQHLMIKEEKEVWARQLQEIKGITEYWKKSMI